jgi:hypothetical protein
MEAAMIITQQLPAKHKLNASITKRIVDFHEQGYIYDFNVQNISQVVCLQNEQRFLKQETLIELIDLDYNEIDKIFTYIHSVDTFYGYKGLLLAEQILSNNPWQ